VLAGALGVRRRGGDRTVSERGAVSERQNFLAGLVMGAGRFHRSSQFSSGHGRRGRTSSS